MEITRASTITEISRSKEAVPSDEARYTAWKNGGEIAAYDAVLMNLQSLVEASGQGDTFVDSRPANPKNAPESQGWYRIDRDKKRFEKLDGESGLKELKPHEAVFIYQNAIDAIKRNKEWLPLTLIFGDDGRPIIDTVPPIRAWVALAKPAKVVHCNLEEDERLEITLPGRQTIQINPSFANGVMAVKRQ